MEVKIKINVRKSLLKIEYYHYHYLIIKNKSFAGIMCLIKYFYSIERQISSKVEDQDINSKINSVVTSYFHWKILSRRKE